MNQQKGMFHHVPPVFHPNFSNKKVIRKASPMNPTSMFQKSTQKVYRPKTGPHSASCIDEQIEQYRNKMEARNFSRKTIETYTYALTNFSQYLARKGVKMAQKIRCEDLKQYQKSLRDRSL